MTTKLRIVSVCLLGVAATLIALGVVSGTLARSVIQVVPALLALAAVFTGYRWSSSATIPIFTFWIIMVVNSVVRVRMQKLTVGSSPALEMALAILAGVFSICGLIASIGVVTGPGRIGRLLAAVLWFMLQIAALFASIRMHR